ncbi:MAG TPA: acyl-CoA dehydrogenase family protein [Acidimicrobiales bacterium]|nr:acyl-CoA dehydrogenase family protein [Acidimicrobiales bacterium]
MTTDLAPADTPVLTPEIEARLEELLAGWSPGRVDKTAFLGRQFDLGLAFVHFPEGCGGLGATPAVHGAVMARLVRAGAPLAFMGNPIGIGMAAPTIATHGTDAQRSRYLRPLFTGEEVWCQLFSEPGNGSDVAGLSTRAERDGDEWVVNGQKVWTSLGHLARFGLLVARTNPDVPKHQGLTYFVADMHAPGVEVRPLFQMTGQAEFNEVYFTDVRVPDAERLGAEGDGWRVAVTTLMNERVAIGGQGGRRGQGPIALLLDVYREHGGGPVARDRVARLWIRAELLRLTNRRAAGARGAGTPGPEGSIGKLAVAELNKDIYDACIDLLGMEGTLYPGGYPMTRPDGSAQREGVHHAFLRSRANSIEGGTTEIMKNILAERVLGLPGDVRVDKDVPWSAVPRS